MTSPAQATTTPSGRYYERDGVRYASVTTILNSLPKQKVLTPWASKMTATAAADLLWEPGITIPKIKARFQGKADLIQWLKGRAYAYRDHKADLGSKTHAWVEAYTLGQPLADPDPDIKGYLEAFKGFLRDYKPEFVASEATVFSILHGYAGTFDWIAYLPLDGKRTLTLGDWKTSKGVYGDYALQMAAYAHGDFIGLPGGVETPMPSVEAAAICHLEPNGTYSLWRARVDQHAFDCFLKVLGMSEWLPELDSFVKEVKAA